MPHPRPIPAWLRTAAWLAVFAWAATIHWASSRTGPEIEALNIFDVWDKAAHFAAFCAGGPPLFLALCWSFDWPRRKVLLLAIATLALYGAADEYHQLHTPNRTGADVLDWAADALGGIAGTLATAFIHARAKITHRPPPARD